MVIFFIIFYICMLFIWIRNKWYWKYRPGLSVNREGGSREYTDLLGLTFRQPHSERLIGASQTFLLGVWLLWEMKGWLGWCFSLQRTQIKRGSYLLWIIPKESSCRRIYGVLIFMISDLNPSASPSATVSPIAWEWMPLSSYFIPLFCPIVWFFLVYRPCIFLLKMWNLKESEVGTIRNTT